MQEINLDMVSGFYGIWRPSQVQIQISNDTGEEKTWQTVYEGEVPAEDNSSRTLTYRTENGDQIVARYLRFNVYFNSKSPWIACKEIRAYDKVSDAAADGTLDEAQAADTVEAMDASAYGDRTEWIEKADATLAAFQ